MVTVVAPTKDGREGLGMSIQDLAAYFYAENDLVTLTQLERLQRVFDLLTGLLDRVGLRKNTKKTVSMACQPFHATGRVAPVAYGQWTTGTGPIFQERQQRRVDCPE